MTLMNDLWTKTCLTPHSISLHYPSRRPSDLLSTVTSAPTTLQRPSPASYPPPPPPSPTRQRQTLRHLSLQLLIWSFAGTIDWTELSENIQSAAITGNTGGMYNGIKKAPGPTLNKTAPLRSSTGEVITDRGHQLKRWVEHYSNIYSKENTVSPSALDAVECLPTMGELDTEPTLEELSKAIDSLASDKAPGSDGILPPPPSPTYYSTARPPYCILCVYSSVSAGKKELYHKTCGTPKSSHSSRTRERGVTATATEASPFSASLAKFLQRSSWSDCRSWQNVSILNHSVASEQEGQQ